MSGRRRWWVALGLILGEHPRLRNKLHPAEVDPARLMERPPRELERAYSLRPAEAQAIFSGAFGARADLEIAGCRERGIDIVTFEDAGYPGCLRRLPDPPACLYLRGGLADRDDDAVAIVGSRKATPYGLQVAERLGREVASAGVTVVSGLARGIDTAAQMGALEGGGRTIAVLGSGMDVTYPRENARLCSRIRESGAVMTEYPLGSPPLPRHFPVRNRLIAGLGSAVVVVEAARHSGSLITARVAADEMGLPVGAVPGPVTSPMSEGCNDLLYDGATPVRNARDILDLLPSRTRDRIGAGRRQAEGASAGGAAIPADLGESRQVLEALATGGPMSADGLASSTGLASAVLLGHLLELEIRGLVRQLPGGLYMRKV